MLWKWQANNNATSALEYPKVDVFLRSIIQQKTISNRHHIPNIFVFTFIQFIFIYVEDRQIIFSMNDTEITRHAYQLEILLPHVAVSYKKYVVFH